jgi:hypothetical protein
MNLVKSNLKTLGTALALALSLVACSSTNSGAASGGLNGYWLTSGYSIDANGRPFNTAANSSSPNYNIASFLNGQAQIGAVTTDDSGNQTGEFQCPQAQPYTISGNQIILQAAGACGQSTFNYTLSGGTLTLSFPTGSLSSMTMTSINQSTWNSILGAVPGI